MNPPESESDDAPLHALVAKSLSGDTKAFRMLVNAYQSYGYALAFRTLRDAEEAKDVLQEAWIRVWRHRTRYRPEIRFTTWFYKIVVNLCYDRIRESSRRRTSPSDGLDPEFAGITDGADLQAATANRNQCDMILKAAERLPPKQYLVFHLRDVEDLSIAEVSDIAGISVAAVKTNLCYARSRIRASLAAEGIAER